MAGISAALVKELRERTNAGMMDCKKALTETNGNLEKAIEFLRKKGHANASKKSGRITAEGLVIAVHSGNKAVVIEVNCETDFVAKDENFINFINKLSEIAIKNEINTIEKLQQAKYEGELSVEDKRLELISKIGENITLRRINFIRIEEGVIASYLHGGKNSAKIASIVALLGGDKDLVKDVAMHVAAMKPEYLKEEDVPKERVEKEKQILLEQAQLQHTGKPQEVLEKIISGKLNKYVKEITLLGQAFVKDPKISIADLLKSKNATVKEVVRFEVGEGIEKKEDNFVEEVMSQVRGS